MTGVVLRDVSDVIVDVNGKLMSKILMKNLMCMFFFFCFFSKTVNSVEMISFCMLHYSISFITFLCNQHSRNNAFNNLPNRIHVSVGLAMRKRVLRSCGICGQRRPRSACVSTQSHQGLHCPLTESFDTIECITGEQTPRWWFAHARYESESVHFACVRRHLFAWCGPCSFFKWLDHIWSLVCHSQLALFINL